MAETPPVLIGRDDIDARVGELAAAIDRDYTGLGTVVLIGVLKGAFIFLADLARRLTVPHRTEFLAVSSYGATASEDPGAVRLLMDVRHPLADQHVIVVEDIVDTGRTLSYLLRLLAARGPASLKTCSLLFKPERTETDITIDYLGFTIPDVWVVGYGLDYAEGHRTLPDICELPPSMR